jgi:pimeloyl-ACP methyl ester carboxylesterase
MGTSAQGIGWPDELVGTLVAGGRQAIRFDHRDTGRSTYVDFGKQPYALADMAADALAVLDGHDVDAAHIVGASLGGAIAQRSSPGKNQIPTTSRRRHRVSCAT